MGPGLRGHTPLELLLDAVVAYRRRGVEPVDDVGVGEVDDQRTAGGTLRFGRGVVRPHAGVAVGLQLEADRAALGALTIARLLDGGRRTEKVLHVVAVLMSDDVGLRERPALGAELRLQLVVEPEVDVHGLVGRAVERPDVGGGRAAPGFGLAGEVPRLARRVLQVRAGELVRPVVLHAVHDADDLALDLRVGVGSALARLGEGAVLLRVLHGGDAALGRELRHATAAAARATAAEDVPAAEDEGEDQADDAEPTTAGGDTAAARAEHASAAAAATAAALVVDLRGVQLGVLVELHRSSFFSAGLSRRHGRHRPMPAQP